MVRAWLIGKCAVGIPETVSMGSWDALKMHVFDMDTDTLRGIVNQAAGPTNTVTSKCFKENFEWAEISFQK